MAATAQSDRRKRPNHVTADIMAARAQRKKTELSLCCFRCSNSARKEDRCCFCVSGSARREGPNHVAADIMAARVRGARHKQPNCVSAAFVAATAQGGKIDAAFVSAAARGAKDRIMLLNSQKIQINFLGSP